MQEQKGVLSPDGLKEKYHKIRLHSENICKPLEIEDYVVQPIVDISPPKWHLGHATWFFETFILVPYLKAYTVFNVQYDFVFNSYYESVGARVVRTDRGNLSRPSVTDIYKYRAYVDNHMDLFLQTNSLSPEVLSIVELGLNHEQQHQELLLCDIKYILGHNPLFPIYKSEVFLKEHKRQNNHFVKVEAGIYEIGYQGSGFCFDNELNRHKVYIDAFEIAENTVTNNEYLEFMQDGGYENFRYWHSEGWEWVKQNGAKAPLYWHFIDGKWMYYTLCGLSAIDPDAPVCHVNFYEASAFAAWKGMRLPTEAEWEVASSEIQWGERWEWTDSAYLAYPGFQKAEGAIGEYNGKFMINQTVLRGASVATPEGHSRNTYRNFFHPDQKWQFMGIRLAQSIK
ncbi:ergothioneine biosynthesis protein EgtB [Flavobacterium sp. 3-210]